MTPRIIIEPGRSEKNYWKDLWRYRELFYILSWRDIRVRYRQTVLGIAWAVIRPLLTMIIFTWVFGRIANMPNSTVAPYAVLVFAGLLPWQFFAAAIAESGNSLLYNEKLVTKVYFPRMIIPASSVITSFADFLISFLVLLALFCWYQHVPPVRILLLPFFTLLLIAVSFGPGLYLAALTAKYRDFRHAVPFIIQFGLFISPIGFESSVVPERWQWLYAVNPMTGIIDAFRWCLIPDAVNPMQHYSFYISIAVCFLLMVVSVYQFRKMEKQFADLI